MQALEDTLRKTDGGKAWTLVAVMVSRDSDGCDDDGNGGGVADVCGGDHGDGGCFE